jgi:biopolymer transport protein ExbD
MFGSPQSLLTDATPELNTTPFIDAMLVLLMMFMLAVPIATHVVHLDTAASHHARIKVPPTARIVMECGACVSSATTASSDDLLLSPIGNTHARFV